MAISKPITPMIRKEPKRVRSIAVVKPTIVIAPNMAAVATNAAVIDCPVYTRKIPDSVKPFSAA